MPVYPVSLSGESKRNPDGTSRQTELKKCRVGEPVTLIREPQNPHDENAIFAVSVRGIGLGYVDRDTAAWLAGRIDTNKNVSAIIASVDSGGAGFVGGILSIASNGEDPATLFSDPKFMARTTAKMRQSSSVSTSQTPIMSSLMKALFGGGKRRR